ncbi:MAG: hypothetical protein Q4G64_06300, partial [bacterium]|nr:hypothetical protein [bacterium]
MVAALLALLFSSVVAALPATAAAGQSGTYAGPITGSNSRTVSFSLDGDTLSGFEVQTYVYCSGAVVPMYWIPSGPVQVAADGSFGAVWYSEQGTSNEVKFELSGSFTSSTTASGTALATMPNLPSCGGGETAAWTAELQTPTYDPTLTLAPSSVTVSEFASSGVVASMSGFPAGAQVTVSAAGVDSTATMNSDGAGTVALTRTASAGDVVVSATDGTHSTSATLTVIPDPVVYDPAVTVNPATIERFELEEAGTLVTATGFPAGAELEMRINGVADGRLTTDGAGAASSRIYPSLYEGANEISVATLDGTLTASTTLTVTRAPSNAAITIQPSEVAWWDTETPISVHVTGIDPNIDVWVTMREDVPGAEADPVGYGWTDDSGAVTITFTGGRSPGTYLVRAHTEDFYHDVTGTLTLLDVDEPVEPEMTAATQTPTISQFASSGVPVFLKHFPPYAEITVSAAGVDSHVSADATGAASVTLVRTVTLGEMTITASDGTSQATTSVTVIAPEFDAEVAVNPATLTQDEMEESGAVIELSGFEPGEWAAVSYGQLSPVYTTVPYPNVEIGADGTASIPLGGSMDVGTYWVRATTELYQRDAWTTFTVTASDPTYPDATLTLTPSTVTVTDFTVDGVEAELSGFAPNAMYLVSYLGKDTPVTTDAGGSGTVMLYRTWAPGTYTVRVDSYEGQRATAELTILPDDFEYHPSLTIDLESGIDLTFDGFRPGELVFIYVDGGESGHTTVDDAGAGTYRVPMVHLPGEHTVQVVSEDRMLATSATFTVTGDDPVFTPTVALEPSSVTESGLAGTGIVANLAGFPANVPVTVTAAGEDTVVTTDAAGAAVASLVRTVAAGAVTVVATDGTHTASAVLTVT